MTVRTTILHVLVNIFPAQNVTPLLSLRLFISALDEVLS